MFTYFVSDVHLGLEVGDAADRQARFVAFLRSLDPADTAALYLLGDIWDFWYEFRGKVPEGYGDVLGELSRLAHSGVRVGFFKGNHDMWCFRHLQSLGVEVLEQPYYTEIEGVRFCLGHGDGLGPGMFKYKCMRRLFRSRIAQSLFEMLPRRAAFGLAQNISLRNRLSHKAGYVFRGEDEPLYKFCAGAPRADYFIFGHFHTDVDCVLPGGGRLMVLRDWMEESPYLYFSGTTVFSGHFPNTEK